MTYEIYRYILFGGAILSGIMLITAVVLFVVLHIPTVIGDLTGANAKKAIESIRNQNTSSGDKTYKSSPVNRERGKLTDRISPSGEIIHDATSAIGGAMATAKISTQEPALDFQPTSETAILSSDAISNDTTALSQRDYSYGETVMLNNEFSNGSTENIFVKSGSVFEIEDEIIFIHTDEVIV